MRYVYVAIAQQRHLLSALAINFLLARTSKSNGTKSFRVVFSYLNSVTRGRQKHDDDYSQILMLYDTHTTALATFIAWLYSALSSFLSASIRVPRDWYGRREDERSAWRIESGPIVVHFSSLRYGGHVFLDINATEPTVRYGLLLCATVRSLLGPSGEFKIRALCSK